MLYRPNAQKISAMFELYADLRELDQRQEKVVCVMTPSVRDRVLALYDLSEYGGHDQRERLAVWDVAVKQASRRIDENGTECFVDNSDVKLEDVALNVGAIAHYLHTGDAALKPDWLKVPLKRYDMKRSGWGGFVDMPQCARVLVA